MANPLLYTAELQLQLGFQCMRETSLLVPTRLPPDPARVAPFFVVIFYKDQLRVL